MIVSFDQAFLKSLKKLKNPELFSKVEALIHKLELLEDIKDLNSIKKLKGFQNYYRLRIGDYRLGLELVTDKEVILIILAHRKDIYTKFP